MRHCSWLLPIAATVVVSLMMTAKASHAFALVDVQRPAHTTGNAAAAGRTASGVTLSRATASEPLSLPRRRSNLVLAMTSPGSGRDSDPDEKKGSEIGSDGGKIFDEAAYEKDRLARDAEAMEAMKAVAKAQLSSGDTVGELRSPWKWQLRKRIWDFMEENDIARFPRPVHHRIPNFVDADLAARRLSELPEFRSATTVKVNPDTPQRPVRHHVLQQGKILLTPQPRLRTGFFSTIEMKELPSLVGIEECTNSKGVVKFGTPVTLNEKYTVDMVVVGSTAVCPRTGARVGKGEGFAELEWGILSAQGNLDPDACPVVTTVHDCQVIDDEDDMPDDWKLTRHDVPVDIIVTPTRVIRVSERAPKPSGIFWDLLSPQKLAAIRVLRQLKQETEDKLGETLPSGPDELLPPVASRKNKGRNKKRGRRQPKQRNAQKLAAGQQSKSNAKG